MSRPGRRSGDDLAYGEYNRWDRDRFDRSGRLPPMPPEPPRGFEEDFRFIERDRPGRRDVLVEDRTESRGPRGRFEERDRIFRETFGDGSRRRTDRELFGDVDPRELAEMAMTPYKDRGEKEIDITIKETRGGRPGVARRQSSLDTFDRRPIPRYDRDEYRIAPYQPIPLPIRRREDEGSRGRGDGTYREVEVKRERSVHRRSGKKSRVSSVSSSSSSDTEVEDTKSRISKPPSFKKGKTKVPKRLVFKEAILDLGYPFIEEEHFYILQCALEKDQIDEVIKVSETYKSADKHKSFRYEERDEEDSRSVSKTETPDRRGRETIIRKEYINPPSDFLGTEASIRSRSSRRAHSPSIESSISQRISPDRARARSFYREERKTVVEEGGESRARAPTIVIPGIIEERSPSNALILQEREYRSDADIKAEILALEAERRALRYERDGDMQVAIIREARPANVERERSPVRNVLRVERDRKGRMALVRSAH